jgi:hypothetical protein
MSRAHEPRSRRGRRSLGLLRSEQQMHRSVGQPMENARARDETRLSTAGCARHRAALTLVTLLFAAPLVGPVLPIAAGCVSPAGRPPSSTPTGAGQGFIDTARRTSSLEHKGGKDEIDDESVGEQTENTTETNVEGEEPAPKSFAEATARFGSSCPAPFFSLPQAEALLVLGMPFSLHGSQLRYGGPVTPGPLRIGVLGSVKDATPETRANLAVAAREFRREGVAFVVVNGDVVGETADNIAEVIAVLAETFSVPLFVHAGNSEWTTALHEALNEATLRWPHVFNMNLVRDVDWGGIHVVALPGYHDRHFLRQGACHYGEDDVADLATYARALRERGEVVVLSAHGPPRGKGLAALDVIHDGLNVGDDALAEVLRAGIRFGFFSHILESGARALNDVDAAESLPLPLRAAQKSLYANVGAASSFPWKMLDGRTTRGLAAIFSVQRTSGSDADATVEFLTLR